MSDMICGHCGFPIAQGEAGIRSFGFWVAHSEMRCLELLKARLAEVTESRDNSEKDLADVVDEFATLKARLAEAEAERGTLIAVVASARERAERAEARLAEAEALRREAHDNIANVIVQANLSSTLTSHPSLSPTHCCVDCGALWRQCDDFSMNLRSASCCDACNNAPVGPQIRPIYVAPSSADVERRPCTCHPDDNPPVPCPRMYALQDCRRAAALRELQQESERLGLYGADQPKLVTGEDA